MHHRRSILYSSSSSARNSRAHRIRDLDVGFPVQSSMSRLCAFFPANAARKECASSTVPTAYQAQQDDRVDSRHFQGRVAVESIKINCAPVFLPCLFLAVSWRDPVGCSLVPYYSYLTAVPDCTRLSRCLAHHFTSAAFSSPTLHLLPPDTATTRVAIHSFMPIN